MSHSHCYENLKFQMVKYLQFYEQFYKELSSLKLTSHVLLYLTTVNSVTGGDTS